MILPPTKPSQSKRLAVFDFDGTLVKPKQGRRFPKDVEDWEWWSPRVPEVLKDLVRRRFRIVLRTDQSKPWKIDMIRAVLAAVPISATVIIGIEKEEKKPAAGGFWEVFGSLKDKIQWPKSFYVGDAAGRPGDWSAVDRDFAAAVGLPFRTPEEMFGDGAGVKAEADTETKLETIPSVSGKRVVIMVGFPGSGKSTWVRHQFPQNDNGAGAGTGTGVFHGDDYPSLPALLKAASHYHSAHPDHSIVFDTTGGTVARRGKFIEFAKKIGFTPVCVWVQTSLKRALANNQTRGEQKIPPIALYAYQKHFVPPSREECDIISLPEWPSSAIGPGGP
jgi:bifunctional polynucleotide phosphatase/kinase